MQRELQVASYIVAGKGEAGSRMEEMRDSVTRDTLK